MFRIFVTFCPKYVSIPKLCSSTRLRYEMILLFYIIAYLYSFNAGKKFVSNFIGSSWFVIANIANHSNAARALALLRLFLIHNKFLMMKPLITMRTPRA